MALKYPGEDAAENFPTNMLELDCLDLAPAWRWRSVVLFCVIAVKNYSDTESHVLASTPQL